MQRQRSAKKLSAKKKEIMPFRRSLFWDVDPKTIDPEKHAEYIIERVLDFGDKGEVKWLFNFYSKRKIVHTLKTTRVLLFHNANRWADYFGIQKKDMRIFQEPYYSMRMQTWPY